MKLTNDQWNRIIQAVVTFIVTVCNIVLMTACTIALSVSKNNQNASQSTEQRASNSMAADSTNINFKK